VADLPYATVDADNHYYEPRDCFVRHMPTDQRHRAFQLALVDGKERPVVDGRPVQTLAAAGFFEGETALPGSLREMMQAIKRGGTRAGGSPLVGPIDPAAFDRERRLELLDAQGIEATLMFPSTAVTVEPAFAGDPDLTWANYRAFNRWLDEDWGLGAAGRIYAAPLISLCDRDAAVAELDWALARGARVVNLSPGPAAGRSPADPWFDPFWARMDEARVICAVHVGDAGYNARLSADWGERPDPPVYEQSAFQWTHHFGDRPIMETISALIYGNLFGRYPNVAVASVENGSLFVGYLMKLMDKMVGMARGGPWPGGKLTDKPSAIFREHVYVSPFHEEDIVGLAELIGSERVLFGSDWPHPEGLANPSDFADGLSTLSYGDVEQIMRTNLARLLATT
jgi:predicted TIM-barrel fold metal-dependent hydrolase